MDSRGQALLMVGVGGTAAMYEVKGNPTFPPELASAEDLDYARMCHEDGVLMPYAARVVEAQ